MFIAFFVHRLQLMVFDHFTLFVIMHILCDVMNDFCSISVTAHLSLLTNIEHFVTFIRMFDQSNHIFKKVLSILDHTLYVFRKKYSLGLNCLGY